MVFEPPPFHVNRPGLVAPVRIDREGLRGPTRQQARGPNWRASSHGLFVPAFVPVDLPEQRILEAAIRLPVGGGVTGWAALRWLRDTWFDGLASNGRDELPVPLASCAHDIRPQAGVLLSQERLDPKGLVEADGLTLTEPVRSVCYEVRYAADLRSAVVALDMAMFFDLVSLAEVAAYVDPHLNGWTGVPRAREALALADENSWSPQETRMRMTWVIEAGLPHPLCNRPVFDRGGRLLGTPDIFDPAAGVAGEFEGAGHLAGDQRSGDVEREELFRDHGLEIFSVRKGMTRASVVRRMHAARARARALWLPPDRRAWTLTPPPWWIESHTVAQRRALTGPARERMLARRRFLAP